MFKFFNKKKIEKVNVLNKKNSNWKMITSLSCASLLTIGAVGGISGSIVASALKYKLSDDYSNFYLCRYELDPYRNDDPTAQTLAQTLTTPEQWAKAGDDAANSFSHYLSSIGYSSGMKVTSEVYVGEDGKEKIYVDAYIPKSEVKEGADNQPTGWDSTATHYSEDASNYINHMNSNRITMILDPNNGTGAQGENLGPAPMAINMEEMVSNPDRNVRVNKDSVNIEFNGDGIKTLNQNSWYNKSANNGFAYNFFTNDGDKTVDDSNGQVYILRDQDSLINRMVFILQCAMFGSNEASVKGYIDQFDDETNKRAQSYIDNWRSLTDNEQKWALAVLQTDGDNGKIFSNSAFKLAGPTTAIDPIKYYDFASNMATATTTSNPSYGTPSYYAGANTPNNDYQNALGYFYRFIDTKTYTKPNNNSNAIPAPAGHGGNGVEWDWMKPYVVAIINKDTALTVVDKYDLTGKDNAYFAKKNPSDSTAKDDMKNFGKYLSIKFNTEFDAKQFKDSFSTYHLQMPVKDYSITTSAQDPSSQKCYGIIKTADETGIKDTNVIVPVSSNINGNFFSKSAILLAIISLAAVILIIGIIVSTIFRIPGFLAWLFITCSTAMTLLFMILANNPISLGIMIGLFVGLTLATMSVFIFMQKLHKYIKREENVVSGFKKAVNNSIWKIIDIHVLGIVVGVCLTYFGISITNMFALTLLLFSLVDIVLIGLWILTSALFLLTKKTDTKTNLIFPSWYFVKNIIEVENTTFNDKKFETTYMPYYKKMNFGFVNEIFKKAWLAIKSPFNKNKAKIETVINEKSDGFRLNFFGFKKEIIGLVIVAIIMIVGTILLFTVGSHGSYYFFGGTRIVIDASNENASNWIKHLEAMGFSGLTKDNNFYYIYSSKIFDSISFSGEGMNSWYFVQRVGHISMGGYISKFAIVFLIASALASAYGFFRIGWTSILPIFIGSLVAPLFTLLAIFTFQIYFDTNIFLFIAALYAISIVLVFGYISNVDNKWTKYQKFDIKELQTAYNLETASSFRFYYLLVFATFILSIFTLMLFGSKELVASYGMLLIGLICTTAIMLYVVRPMCFWMTIARFGYSRRVGENNFFFKKNYDKIDEQNIDGINKFKKDTIQL